MYLPPRQGNNEGDELCLPGENPAHLQYVKHLRVL